LILMFIAIFTNFDHKLILPKLLRNAAKSGIKIGAVQSVPNQLRLAGNAQY